MNYIMGFDLSEALKTADRVYLCGDLKRQQDLKWIHDTGIEIGVSHYKDFASDRPHFHANATEYNFVMDGASKVLLIDEKKEYLFTLYRSGLLLSVLAADPGRLWDGGGAWGGNLGPRGNDGFHGGPSGRSRR